MTWTGRIIVWGFLGPHMKLVDLVLRSNQTNQGTVDELMKNFDIQSKSARLKREHDLKIKDMKQLAFGKYSVEVPSFNLCKSSTFSSNRTYPCITFTHWYFRYHFDFVCNCSTSLRSASTSIILKSMQRKAKEIWWSDESTSLGSEHGTEKSSDSRPTTLWLYDSTSRVR